MMGSKLDEAHDLLLARLHGNNAEDDADILMADRMLNNVLESLNGNDGTDRVSKQTIKITTTQADGSKTFGEFTMHQRVQDFKLVVAGLDKKIKQLLQAHIAIVKKIDTFAREKLRPGDDEATSLDPKLQLMMETFEREIAGIGDAELSEFHAEIEEDRLKKQKLDELLATLV